MGIAAILSFIKEVFFNPAAVAAYVKRNRFTTLLFIAVLFLFALVLLITEQAVQRQTAVVECRNDLKDLDKAIVEFSLQKTKTKMLEDQLYVCQVELIEKQVAAKPAPKPKPKPKQKDKPIPKVIPQRDNYPDYFIESSKPLK